MPTIGSAVSCGRAPWPPPPLSAIAKLSAEAASGPACATIWPTAKRRSTCAPKIAVTPSSAPDSSTPRAPRPVSSAGCSTISTSPAAGRAVKRYAAPTAQAACTSWPQACITPGLRDANGRPVFSAIGSASMSPRTATGASPESPPRSRATRPVPATRSSRIGLTGPKAACSTSAVRSSRPDSSGCSCRSRRSSTRMRRNDSGNRASSAPGSRPLTRGPLAGRSGPPPDRGPRPPPCPPPPAAPARGPRGPWSTRG